MFASGMVTLATAAEPAMNTAKSTAKQSTKQATATWKARSKVDSKVKKVSARQVDEGVETAAKLVDQAAQAITDDVQSAVEQAPAALPEKTSAAEATELPVKPVESGSMSPSGESATTEVIEEVVPVSVSTGLCPPGRLWVRKEVLLWWMDGQDTPPLVTTSPNGTPVSQAGVLGQPGTSVLFGGPLNDDLNVGGRFQVGYWLDKCNTCGIQAGFFFLGQNDTNFNATSDGSSIIARPFFDADPQTNAQNSELVSYPGVLRGSVDVDSSTSILGADLGFRHMLCSKNSCAPACTSTCCSVPGVYCCRWDVVSGFQYLRLRDNIGITENLTSLGQGPVSPGTTFLVNDRFKAQNNFYGFDIGTVGTCYRGRWFIEGLGRIGIGAVDRNVRITGNTVVTVPGGSTTNQQGGLLTQPTNIGDYHDTTFGVMPQVGLNVGYQVCKYARVYAGYSFLGLSGVARAGEQIDPVVNSTQLGGGTLVGPARPAFVWNDSFFWAQGVNIGLDCRF
jgi:hypothetical protein